jgi:putative protease
VLNQKAAAFYRRHGVTKLETAAESGLDLRGHRVMTTRYCLKYELGMCPKEPNPRPAKEPLMLVDEDGKRLELRFDCARCEMQVYLER